MSGAQQDAVGVSDEAVRLVAALADLAAPGRVARDASDEPPVPPAASQSSADSGPAPSAGTRSAKDAAPASSMDDPAAAPAPPGCSCGAPGVESICRVCPVCRVAAFLTEVRPETVDRIADLLGLVAGSLQAFAEQRRAQQAGADEPEGAAARPAPPAEWEPVDIVDVDDTE